MKTTPWFKPGQKNPVRRGVYLVTFVEGTRFKHWDGMKWGCYADTPNEAVEAADEFGAQVCFEWRGLLKESK
jgi:hypothetical protein